MMRFIGNCRKVTKDRRRGELSVDELMETDWRMIVKDQEQHFNYEMEILRKGKQLTERSKLIRLNPILDEEGLIRSNSRVVNAQFMSKDARYPIILADGSWITRLIIGYFHELQHHNAGVNQLLSDLGTKYWILKARKNIKVYENECFECKRRRAKGMQQIMAPLPSFRFEEPLEVFARTAVDFAGPFETIQGRGKSRAKRYLCLFTCLQSRAVHLEMAYGLDTDAFIRVLLRFIARRGKPKMILSDNGTNFIGAIAELSDVVIDGYKIKKLLSDHEIRWVLNPPMASHFGGVFEALIKSAKKAINAILKNAEVNDEELSTIIVKAEEMLNSRPLMVQIIDGKEVEVLTPNHFLRSRWCEDFKHNDIEVDEKVRFSRRWRYILEVRSHIWKRWMKELVPIWGTRAKWNKAEDGIKKGDVVWVLDKTNDVGRWPLARVLEEMVGEDGRTEVVKLVCERKEIIRPICRIFPLEI
jgi:hypothetical protein